MEIRLLSLWQPWASLIALGLKQYETRSWETGYRGKIAIHAAKRPVNRGELAAISSNSLGHLTWEKISSIQYPLGCIVAIANLKDCRQMIRDFEPPCNTTQYREIRYSIADQSPLERAVGDWSAGRYAWKFENIIALPEPLPFKGTQGLRKIDLADFVQLEALVQGGKS